MAEVRGVLVSQNGFGAEFTGKKSREKSVGMELKYQGYFPTGILRVNASYNLSYYHDTDGQRCILIA